MEQTEEIPQQKLDLLVSEGVPEKYLGDHGNIKFIW
jgi:hypothetical protein